MNRTIKRFYENVAVVAVSRGFQVQLDGRPVRSPGGQSIILPGKRLADALAREWQEQEKTVAPALMPVMRLVSRIEEQISPRPETAIAEIVKYARSDLLCYRAEDPEPLIRRQQEKWDPVLARFRQEENISFATTAGIVHVEQNSVDIGRFAALLKPLPLYSLGAVFVITTLTGSALLAVAMQKQWISPQEAWNLSNLDEDYQNEQWGRDGEAQERRKQDYREFCAAALVLAV